MLKQSSRKTGLCVSALFGIMLADGVQADYVDDSSLKLDLRNFYFDRNYIDDGGTEDDLSSWSQGADLQFVSGYTDTPIRLGLDANVTAAYIFSNQNDDGSVPVSGDGDAPSGYARGGVTFKAQYSKTELKVGDMRPHLPIAWDDTSRQLDTIYEGAVITSHDIPNLELVAGRFWKGITRNSSDREDFYLYGTDGSERSSGLNFAGGTYDLSKQLSATYYFGQLRNIYKQQYFGLAHKADLGDGYKLTSDLRYFDNREDGDALYGDIDSRALGWMETLTKGNHMVALSYQHNSGDSMFPTMNGYIPQPYLVHWSDISFVRPDEDSYGIRYSYDFKGWHLPGLKVFTRFIYGNNIDVGNVHQGTENERDIYLSYTVPSGPLEGLSFSLHNTEVSKSFASDFEEFRFATTYTYKFF